MKLFRFKKAYQKKNRGVTIFFALLVISLMLGIGTSISLLAQKQVSLSTLNKQSELAFYAADSAAECAQYWDVNPRDAFDPLHSESIVIDCNRPDNLNSINVCTASFSHSCASTIHEFNVNFGNACAHVIISKEDINGLWITTIESHGYNTCGATTKRLERAVYLRY